MMLDEFGGQDLSRLGAGAGTGDADRLSPSLGGSDLPALEVFAPSVFALDPLALYGPLPSGASGGGGAVSTSFSSVAVNDAADEPPAPVADVGDGPSGFGGGYAIMPAVLPVSFTPDNLVSYSNQDKPEQGGAGAVFSDGGATLLLEGNIWRRALLDQRYLITEDTRLTVDVALGTTLPEVAGIGIDLNDNPFDDSTLWQLGGTQSLPRTFFAPDQPGGDLGNGFTRFEIDLGIFAGTVVESLIILSDDDKASDGLGSSTFTNVALIENAVPSGNQAPVVAAAPEAVSVLAGAPIDGLYTLETAASFFFDPEQAPLTVSFDAATLPPGVSVAPDGSLVGAPLVPGTFQIGVTAEDPEGLVANTDIPFAVVDGDGFVVEIEAEDFTGFPDSQNFFLNNVSSASGGQIIRVNPNETGIVETALAAAGLPVGTYELAVDLYDETDGDAVFTVTIGGQVVADTSFDAPGTFLSPGAQRNTTDGAGNLKRVVLSSSVTVGPDDILVIEGVADAELLRFDKLIFTSVTLPPAGEPPADVSLSSAGVAENAAGAVIGTLGATDPDGDDAAITFSVDLAGDFEVVGTTLKLKDGISLDFEAASAVSVDVTATDADGLVASDTFVITVTDVNEAPTGLVVTGGVIVEETPGAVVGTLSAVDPEGDSAGITFSVDPASLFEVVGTTLKLKDGESVDADVTPTLTVDVTATDAGGAFSVTPVIVAVTTSAQAPTDVGLTGAPVAENDPGAIAGTLSALDPDGDSGAIVFSVDPASIFEVSGTTLKLKDGAALDFEAGGTVTVDVTATDADNLFTTVTLNVPVADVNEAPVIDPAADLGTVSFSEGTGGTVALASLAPADPDAGDVVTLDVELDDGSPAPAGITITGDTLTVDPSVGTGTYALAVFASDGALRSATAPLLVTVTPAPTDTTADEGGDLSLGAPAAVAPDALDAVSLRLTGVDPDIAQFELSEDGGASFAPLSVTPDAGGFVATVDLSSRAGSSFADLVVRVTDGVGNQATAAASVLIEDSSLAFNVTFQAENFFILNDDDLDIARRTTSNPETNDDPAIGADGLWDGFNGNGYLDLGNDVGDRVGFAVSAPESRTYTVEFRYANDGGSDRPLTVFVGGQPVGQIPFEPTGAWDDWQIATIEVPLLAGQNQIWLENAIGNGPNIDQVVVTNGIAPPPPETIDTVIKVNFEPVPGTAGAPPNYRTPDGFEVDSGLAFGDRGNGFTYGWMDVEDGTQTILSPLDQPSTSVRYRTDADGGSDLQRTYAHFQFPGGAGGEVNERAWEIELPNGFYELTVAIGDTGGPFDSVYVLNAEGQQVGDTFTPFDPTGGVSPEGVFRSDLVTTAVEVTDGRLTLDGFGGSNVEIQWLEIRALEDLTPTDSRPAPLDYALFQSPVAVAGVGASRVEVALEFVNGQAPTGVAPDSDITIGLEVVADRGTGDLGRAGISLESLIDGSIHLEETLSGLNVLYNANTSGGNDTVTITPSEPLKANTSYTLVIDGALDLGENDGSGVLREFQTFTTTFVTGPEREVEPTEVAFTETIELDGAADGVFGLGSITLSPDGRYLYATTLSGSIERWRVDPTDGSLVEGSRETLNLTNDPGYFQNPEAPDLNTNGFVVGTGRAIIGIAFDPTDPNILWVTDNFPVPLTGRNPEVPEFSGRLSRINLDGTTGTTDIVIDQQGTTIQVPAFNAWAEEYVTGLPRSAGDHLTNSIAFRANPDFDPDNPAIEPEYHILLTQGANTAIGGTDPAWGSRPERLLSAGVLKIDPTRDVTGGPIDVTTEPLPDDGQNRRFLDGGPTDARDFDDVVDNFTVIRDGETLYLGRVQIPVDAYGGPDAPLNGKWLHFDERGVATVRETEDPESAVVRTFYDPYAPDAAVEIFATGVRNGYDIVVDDDGRVYLPGNGTAAGGRVPDDPSTGVNEQLDNVSKQDDTLYLLQEGRYYGSPNPLRGEYIAFAGNLDPDVVPGSLEVEPEGSRAGYQVGTAPDPNFDALNSFSLDESRSPNGAVIYSSSVFGASLQGFLLVAEYSQGNDVIAIPIDENGRPNVDARFAITDENGQVLSWTDPLDIAEGPKGVLYISTLDRNTGASQVIRLTPDPGARIVDNTADEGNDLALVPVDVSDSAAAVFDVLGLDGDIVSTQISFDGGATTDPVLIGPLGRFTVDLSGLTGSVTGRLIVRDALDNTAFTEATFTLGAPGTVPQTLVMIEAEDGDSSDGAFAIATGSGITVRDQSNPERSPGSDSFNSGAFVEGLRPGAFGIDGNTDYSDGTPGGYVDYGNNNNNVLTFTFDVPADRAGAATLVFRYANGSSSDRPLQVAVNGADVGAPLDFGPTPNVGPAGGWGQWLTEEITITLSAGTNTVSLQSVNNTGPNLDRLEVIVNAPPPPFEPVFVSVVEEARIEVEATDGSAQIVDDQSVNVFFTVDEDAQYAIDLAANAGAPAGGGLTLLLNGTEIGTTAYPGVGDTGEVSITTALLAGVDYTLEIVSDAPGASALDYVDIADASTNPNADIVVTALEPGPFPDRLQFNYIDTGDRAFKDTGTIRVENAGTEDLLFEAARLTGPFVLTDADVFDGLVLAPGASVDVTVAFDPAAYTGPTGDGPTDSPLFAGVLEIDSNDREDPTVTVDLAGFWQVQPEFGFEPNVNEIWSVFGFGNEIAGLSLEGGGERSILSTNDVYGTTQETRAAGEILSPYFRIADGVAEARITQIAAFKGTGGTNVGIHAPGDKSDANDDQLWRFGDDQNQSVLPLLGTDGGDGGLGAAGPFSTVTFAEDDLPAGWGGLFGVEIGNLSQDPTLNEAGPVLVDAAGAEYTRINGTQTATAPDGTVVNIADLDLVQQGHVVKVFQAQDAAGQDIANTFLVVMDFTGINYDYNDNVLLVEGVVPGGLGQDIAISGLDDAAADDRLVFSRIDNPESSVQETRDSASFEITNEGTATLTISGLSVTGADASAFVVTGVADGTTLDPGESITADVTFVGSDPVNDNKAVFYEATLLIDSDDAANPQAQVVLAGLAQIESQRSEEPSVAEIVRAFGYTTDVDQPNLRNNGVVEVIGDEVLMPYMQALDPAKAVTVTNIAAYQGPNVSRLNVHGLEGNPVTELFANDDQQFQTILPDGWQPGVGDTGPAVATFTRSDPFGLSLLTDGRPNFASWTDPEANERDPFFGDTVPDGLGHYMRFFQALDADGNPIEGRFIGIQDYPGGGNFDYNDLMFVIDNVAPYDLTAADDANGNTINDALENDIDNDGLVDFFDTDDVPPPSAPADALVAQLGTVTVTQADPDDWTTVTFDQPMTDPVVIIGPVPADGDPTTVRVRNVTTTGFEVQLDEWAYQDGIHAAASVDWMAAERGVHLLSDGRVIEAGTAQVSDAASSVALAGGFSSAPVVLGQVASEVDPAPVTERIDNVSASGFDVRLQEEEDADGLHTAESLDYIAIEAGTSALYEAGFTGAVVTNNATTITFTETDPTGFFADMHTENGSDTAVVRGEVTGPDTASVFIEEEESANPETAHVNGEDVGWLVWHVDEFLGSAA